ncbi:hypothetical protein C3L33_06401, partial [Rhododendron williamsianum]
MHGDMPQKVRDAIMKEFRDGDTRILITTDVWARVLDVQQVVQEALDKANVQELDLSAVAVTIGPGLSLCLRVGVQKLEMAGTFSLPMVGVHHMDAHVLVARYNVKLHVEVNGTRVAISFYGPAYLSFSMASLVLSVAVYEVELVNLAMDLAPSCLVDVVCVNYVGVKDFGRLNYHCDLLTRGVGGTIMENRKAEEWASQIQCWFVNHCRRTFDCLQYRLMGETKTSNSKLKWTPSSVPCVDREGLRRYAFGAILLFRAKGPKDLMRYKWG